MVGSRPRRGCCRPCAAGKKERYSGTEHSVRELVDKAKLERACFGGVCAGKKERYSGTEHSVRELVDKAKLDVVVFRSAPGCQTVPTLKSQTLKSQNPKP